jgi:tetratricopeptide (TPR) repeat protein
MVTERTDNFAWPAHQDIQDIFRTNNVSVAEACRGARDRLAAIDVGKPELPQSWDAYRILAADLRTLLGFMHEHGVLSSEPAAFRSLVINVLNYLYEADQSKLGVVMARVVRQRWTAELGETHEDAVSAAERLAACLHGSGDAQAALPIFRDILRLRSRVKGPGNPTALSAAANLAACLGELEEYHAALRLSQDTVTRCTQVLGSSHDTTLRAVRILAGSLFGLGEYRVALGAYTTVYEQYLLKAGTDHLSTLSAADSVAITRHCLGDYEVARAMNEQLLRRYERVLGKADRRTAAARDRLSTCLRALGRDREARLVHGPIPDF